MWLLLVNWGALGVAQLEMDEGGQPLLWQQWRPQKVATPAGVMDGWRTQMRREGARYLVFWFEPTTQIVEVSFFVKTPPKGERGISFGLSFGAPIHWANEGVRLAFGGNGWLLRRDVGDWFTWRSRFSWLTVSPFAFETWVKVRLVADPIIGAFQLWLNDQLTFHDLLPFSSPVPQVSCFFLFNGEGTGTTVEVSRPDIRIGTLPNAPKRLRVQPISALALQLSWQPSATKDVRAYRIYRRGQKVAEVPANQTQWTDAEVRTGEAYGYFVTAVTEASESLPSWSDAAMPLPPLPLKETPKRLETEYEIVVVGATPAGIAAAVAAARMGRKVALVERTTHIGGMMTGGLSATDRRYRQASGGLFAEFLQRIRTFYAQAYGENSPQLRACRDGYLFEPKVALQVFRHLLAETPNLHLYLRQEMRDALKAQNRLVAVLLYDRQRKVRWKVKGRLFIDATYEGDLAAKAGVPCRVGREGREEFGEEFAGEVFWDTTKMHLPPEQRLSFGKPDGDHKMQAYNYRLTLTKRADNRILLAAPPDYDPERYAEIAQRVQEGVLWHPMEVVSLVKLPQQKFDANNTPGPFPSTDFIGANYDYPDADWHRRDEIARAHRNYIVGLLYFLQTDTRLPNEFRVAAQHWSLAADEFADHENFPPQLYVREARRIVGEYIFTEHDARPLLPGRRAPVHEDSIAVAEYPIDSHATTPRDPQQPYVHEGFFYLPGVTVPSHVPYRVLLPRAPVENLLVCGAVSATHIGFGTLRLEPVWMALGQAAGVAAHLALERGVPLRKVPVDELQKVLLEQKQVIAFFHDLPSPETPEFAAVQFFAVRGFFDTYEVRAQELVDEGAARKMLHRFAELVKRPISVTFGTAHKTPTQGDILRWLTVLAQSHESVSPVVVPIEPEKPITRGQLCVWLYRLWWELRR